MNRMSSARASANIDRYSASGLTADETASSGPTLARSTSRSAPRAANGTTTAAATTATTSMPAPSAVRRWSAREGRRETRTPLDAAARRSDRIRSSRLRHASHSRLASRPAMPSAVSTGAEITTGPRTSGALTVVRPKNSPNETIASATGTAPYAAREARHDSTRPAQVPTRNTMSAGTSRLRYVPTGRSTVTRSFHANSAPETDVGEPPEELEGLPRREGTASGMPSTKNAMTTQPGHAPTAPVAAPCERGDRSGHERADADQEQERPIPVDRPRGDSGDRHHRREEQRPGDDAGHEHRREIPGHLGSSRAPSCSTTRADTGRFSALTRSAFMTSLRAREAPTDRRGCRRSGP